MKQKMPRCPYCDARMRPHATQDGWKSYVCPNPECKAVSPRDRSFGRALDKAKEHVFSTTEWFDRSRSEPTRADDFLCEYAFFDVDKPDDEPVLTFFGVRQWNEKEKRFAFENEAPDTNNHTLRVLRWLDFKKVRLHAEASEWE